MFRVLDLFAGIGGTARGIQKFLLQHKIDFEYIAVDNNLTILEAHSNLNPNSKVCFGDAYEYDLRGFNFIWASPPCQSHSKLNLIRKKEEDCQQRLEKMLKILRAKVERVKKQNPQTLLQRCEFRETKRTRCNFTPAKLHPSGKFLCTYHFSKANHKNKNLEVMFSE